MSRRARAAAFGALALVCAALAASLAGDYRGGVEAQLGELRPVVVARSELSAQGPLRRSQTRELLEVRRVPARFAPVDALGDPLEAVGRAARAPVPKGAYVTHSLLRVAGGRPRPSGRPAPGREPVEITVAGAGALGAAGDPVGRTFDVIATGEPDSGGPGHASVVAERVELLALDTAGPGEGLTSGASAWTATVAASREDAMRLIEAHNYAREIRLIGSGP